MIAWDYTDRDLADALAEREFGADGVPDPDVEVEGEPQGPTVKNTGSAPISNVKVNGQAVS